MGITVTEVSPGWVDTDFISISKETDEVPDRVFKHLPRKEDVVAKAMRDADRGRGRSVIGLFYKVHITMSTHFPRLATNVWKSYFGHN